MASLSVSTPTLAGPKDGSSSALASPTRQPPVQPFVCIVDFNHARGPEVEAWIGLADQDQAQAEDDWPLLPFMALCDGAHALTEEFSYFTLPYARGPTETSLFGIACTRQLDASKLVVRPDSVTRSTVQKSVVVVCHSPLFFAQVKDSLSVVTAAWFNQHDFSNTDILVRFHAQLSNQSAVLDPAQHQHFGLSFRELIFRFRHQALVLFKACLLQKKILFFGSLCERLCLAQFALVSLVPQLLDRLGDCADPAFGHVEQTAKPCSSLQSSDRSSLLGYMGMPLHLFGKGSFFGPYIPLQQLDLLADEGTQSYMVGSTNSLLLQQKDRYSDVFVNMDDYSVSIAPHLRSILQLTVADRRWIDGLTEAVTNTWDEQNPGRPNTMKYFAGEDFLRVQFEEYVLALASTSKYHDYLVSQPGPDRKFIPEIGDRDPFLDFGIDWTAEWVKCASYGVFSRIADGDIYNVTNPLHPCAGQLGLSDIHRRVNHHLADLHLDERLASSQEVVAAGLANGQKKLSAAISRLLSDFEERRQSMEESTRDGVVSAPGCEPTDVDNKGRDPVSAGTSTPPVSAISDASATAAASVKAASARAGEYFSRWGSWAAEKRAGWSRQTTAAPSRAQSPAPCAATSSGPASSAPIPCAGPVLDPSPLAGPVDKSDPVGPTEQDDHAHSSRRVVEPHQDATTPDNTSQSNPSTPPHPAVKADRTGPEPPPTCP